MRDHPSRASILLAAIAILSWQPARASEGPSRIWILPFQQLESDPSLEYLQEALPALLTVAVSGAGDSNAVVDRHDLDRVLAEQALTLAGLTSNDSRHRIGKLLGATVMITGSFVRQDQQLLIAMRATDLSTGAVAATAEGSGPVGRLAELIGDLYRRLAATLDRRLPDLSQAQIDETPVSNLHFMKGLGHYHGARYSQALAEFVLAGEDERLTDIARFWQANAYLAQRQYAHAYLELSRMAARGLKSVREQDIAARMRICEQQLNPDEVRMIRAMAVRRAPAPK